jgi:hypothetical protein
MTAWRAAHLALLEIDRLIVFLFQIDDAVPAEPGGWRPVFASSATIW